MAQVGQASACQVLNFAVLEKKSKEDRLKSLCADSMPLRFCTFCLALWLFAAHGGAKLELRGC
jgi:hypothetical protein